MKKLPLVLFGVALLMVFQSCVSQKLSSGEFQRQWMLVSFKDYSRDFLVENKAQMDLSPTKSPANQYSASMGCNNMFFNAEFFKNGTVKFSDVGSTMMYCEGKMQLESDFGKFLPSMTKYKIDGHHLTLSDGKGNEMKFNAADWD